MGTTALRDTCSGDGSYPELVQCLAVRPSRWSEPTIAAAKAIPGAEEVTRIEWEALLDRIEIDLGPLVVASASRLRARPISR